MLAALAAPETATAQHWSRVDAPTSPPPRQDAALAFDPLAATCVLFGGLDLRAPSPWLADTWTFEGSTWTRRAPVHSPPAREGHGLVFDTARSVTVLFGGTGAGLHPLDDTWSWNGMEWTELSPRISPAPRSSFAFVHDAARARTVLFGGADAAGVLGDTWEWDGAVWSPRTSAHAPSARAGAAACWDARRGVLVMHGGFDTSRHALDETWEWDGADWRQVATRNRPPAWYAHGMAFDPGRGTAVAFGGRDAAATPLDETWEFDGADWYRVHLPLEPGSRIDPATVWDGARGVLVAFGGQARMALGDTWTYGGGGGRLAKFGAGCAGSGGELRLAPERGSLPRAGGELALVLTGLPPSGPSFLALGAATGSWAGLALPARLGFLGRPACTLSTSIDVLLLLGNPGTGTLTWRFTIPSVPTLTGAEFGAQALAIDLALSEPVPLVLSNGMMGVIG